MLTRRNAFDRLARFAALAALPTSGWAQSMYPSKPIRYVVPFPAGGLTDVMARLVGQKLTESLRQPVVVDNKPGASANLGAEFVAKAAPDGYTWLAVTLAHAVNQSLFPSLPYSLEKNLIPVVHLATSPLALVVHVDSPVRTLREFLGQARSRVLNGGSSGNGTPPHLGLELLALRTKLDIQHVPYKGGAPSLNDLLGKQLDFIVSNLPESSAYIKSGKLRALAVTSAKRHPLLPEVPTFAEAGLDGMELENWTGLVMPAGTPEPIMALVAENAIKAVRQPDVSARVASMGFTPTGLGPAEFGAIVQKEVAHWREIVKARDLKPG